MMGLPARRVAEMLELVGLTDTEANRRVGNSRSACASGSALRPR